MFDEVSVKRLEMLLAQAEATEESLRKVDGAAKFGYNDPATKHINALIREAREALQDSGLPNILPSSLSPPTMRGQMVGPMGVGNLLVAISGLKASVEAALEDTDSERSALKAEIDALNSKLAEAEVRSLNIVDDDLRDRCLDLILRPGKADTAVREAAVVLEDRIRKVSGLGPDYYGVGLVDKALSPKGGLLDFGGPKSEWEGLHQLYRGVIGFFKNPTSHRIIEDYDITRARQVVGLIDLLLQLLRDANRKEAAGQTGESATP